MKKLILLLLLFIFLLGTYTNLFAYCVGYDCGICDFHAGGPEQFTDLLKTRDSKEFQKIAVAIATLAITKMLAPKKSFNNPECSIYEYTRKLLRFYHKNKRKITEDKFYITKTLDLIQEMLVPPYSTAEITEDETYPGNILELVNAHLKSLFSSASSDYTKPEKNCDFEKIIASHNVTRQREFDMLLEPSCTPNFQTAVFGIVVLISASPEELNDEQCPIYKYTRELLDYYKQNKEQFIASRLTIAKLLDIIQEKITPSQSSYTEL